MPFAPGQLTWLDLSTPDLPRSAAFYEALLGWRIDDQGEEFGHYHVAKAGEQQVAGLMTVPDASSAWMPYLATEDAAATLERATAAGGARLFGPDVVGDLGTMAAVTDQGGSATGLWQTNRHEGTAAPGPQGTIAWAENRTRDYDDVVEFVGAVFGLPVSPLEGPPMRYAIVGPEGGAPFFGIQDESADATGAPSRWMVWFCVDEADAAVERAVAAGGTLLSPAVDSPHGRFATLADPLGAVLVVVELPR